MRHYSKVIIELPDGPEDPPYAVVSIDCDVCGEEELRIHMSHLGTLMRVLQLTMNDLHDEDGIAEPMSGVLPGTPVNKAKIRDYFDREFPGWKADRIRRRSEGT